MALIIIFFTIIIQVICGIISFVHYLHSRQTLWLFITIALFLFALAEIIGFSMFSSIPIISVIIGFLTSITLLLSIFFARNISREYERTDAYLKTLWDIDRIMLTSLTPWSMLNSIKSRILEMIDCDALAIYRLEQPTKSYKVFTNHNLNQNFHNQMLSKENDFFWNIIDKRKPNVLSNLSADTNFGFPSILKSAGFRACVGVPLILRGLPIACLFVFSTRANPYHKKEMKFIEGIGRQIVIAIERMEIFERTKKQNVESVLALVQAIELRDPYTKGHSLQVANLAVELYKNISPSDQNLELIEYAGLLHDVGKIAVPELVLNKPSSLTKEEWAIMKRHPIQSTEIIRPIKALNKIIPWILYHHERIDGSGYPEGLKGNEIPVESRVLAICDAFSAMVGKRPYRSNFKIEQAIDEIKKFSGKQFDPGIVKIFLALPDEKLKIIIPEKPS